MRNVSLKAASGQFVAAEDTGKVIANRGAIGEWEVWRLFDIGGGNVALQSAHSRYLCAENNGANELVANRTTIGSWETFALVGVDGNHLALKACNNKYVCAENGGGQELIANRDKRGPWETFEIVENPVAAAGANSADVVAEARPHGLVLTLSHQAAQDLAAGGGAIAGIAGAVAPVAGPAGLALGVIAGALAAVAGLVKAVDHGNGVYLTMLWITPGLFVPTSR